MSTGVGGGKQQTFQNDLKKVRTHSDFGGNCGKKFAWKMRDGEEEFSKL